MDEKQLQYYCVLYEMKNITKAAEHLYISRTGLSISIKKLERELGIELFYRKNDGVELTEYGIIFYQAVVAQRQIMSDCLKKINHIKSQTAEVIQLGMSSNILPSDVIHYIFQFEQIYPSVIINIVDNRAIDYFDALTKREIDIAFAVCPPQNLHLQAICLSKSEQIIMMNQKNPLAAKESIDFTCDLRGQTLLETESRMLAHLDILHSFGIQRKHVIGDYRILQQMLNLNKGCIITLPRLSSLYASDHVCTRPLKNLPSALNLNPHLVYRPNSSLNIRRFVQYMVQFCHSSS